MRKIVRGMDVSIVLALSSLSIYSYAKDSTHYYNSSNDINNLEKVTINTDSNNLLNRLTHIQIVKLSNGGYILISNNMQGQYILDKKNSIRAIQIVEAPKT